MIAVAPHYTSQDYSNCGHRVKKSLSTRTHQCPKCKAEICRDTNVALNILNKGMKVLGIEWNKGTEGHSGTSGKPGTQDESSTAVDEEKSDSISCLVESRITLGENPAL